MSITSPRSCAPILSFPEFCARFDISLFPHQAEDFGEVTERVNDRFKYPLAGVSWPRGDGKTEGLAATGLWRLVTSGKRVLVLSVALDTKGAEIILQYAGRLVRQHPVLASAVRIHSNRLELPATGSEWVIRLREHEASRGLHPDTVLYDECGWASDSELFGSLLAGQASVADPLMVVASTVGRSKEGPLWEVKQLAEGGDPNVLWRWSGENRSPKVTADFLARQRRILLPTQYAREHQNLWVEAADSFAKADDVDAAMGHGWTEQLQGVPGRAYHHFTDIGTVNDPTVHAVGHREQARIFIDRIITLQGSRETPVLIATVERVVREAASAFPPERMRIESWQGVGVVQSLENELPVEVFQPTVRTNSEEWPVLAQHLIGRTLVCPPHARLREELLNLAVEVGPTGARVTDRGRVHQDHAVSVRGVVATLSDQRNRMSPEMALRCLSAGEHIRPSWATLPRSLARHFR